jgi:cell division protein FtsN
VTAAQQSPAPALADAPKPKHVINPHAADGADPIDSLIAKADKPKTTPAKPGDAPVLIQIGAFSSEALADKEWSKVASIAPGPMAGKGKRVVPISKDGATLYRTSITGFASRDQAQGVCDRLVAAGGKCFVR